LIIDAHLHCDPTALRILMRALDLAGIDRAVVLSRPGLGEPFVEAVAREGHGRLRVALAPDVRLAGTPRWDIELVRLERLTADLAAIKLYKQLGFGIVNADGRRISLLSPELESLWELVEGTGLPVILHCGDPADFWRERPRLRARQLELHPEWWYATQPDVKPRALMYRERAELVHRYPGVCFVGAHLGGFPEGPEPLEEYLQLGPVDTSAALEEALTFDRRIVLQIVDRYPDRIMWGSDLILSALRPGTDTAAVKIAAKYLVDSLRLVTEAVTLPTPSPLECPWTVRGLGLSGSSRAWVLQRTASRILWRD
jgi:hypothetical protein